DSGDVTHVRRDLGRDSKETCSVSDLVGKVQTILDDIQDNMYNQAKAFLDNRIFEKSSLAEMREFFAKGEVGYCKIDSALWETDEFNAVCDEFSLTPRCMPLADGGQKVLVGKAY
ncbi:MAG: hypothetical protein VX196_04180, partial [Pseudomonadota bacterium]|nr:hypothetical protein [Pseudomonadota bacterium]